MKYDIDSVAVPPTIGSEIFETEITIEAASRARKSNGWSK